MNIADFKSTIVATSNAWLVEFYSSWCGHCIDFAPAYIQLANDVKGISILYHVHCNSLN
jgi:thiol oxidase